MSETWDNGTVHDSRLPNGFEGSGDVAAGETGQEETGRIQEDKINKKRLAELEEDGKMLQVFVRPNKKSGLTPYTAVKEIPQTVAMICCKLLYEKFSKGHKYYIIEDSNLCPYNFIFEWIKQCGAEKGVANMPEIREIATPKTGLQPFIDIMLAAQKLKIPTASFNKFMVKKLTPIARDHLIDLEVVSRIFDSGDTDIYGLDLQDIAAISIFSHWYDYKLDADDYEEYMCNLYEMRENIPELDEALHKAVNDKDEFLKKRRQEKRDQAAAEQSGGGGWDANNGEANGNGNFDAGADFSTFTSAAVDNSSWIPQGSNAPAEDWEANGVTAGTNDWIKPEDNKTSHGDWADEVNENFKATPAIPAGGDW